MQLRCRAVALVEGIGEKGENVKVVALEELSSHKSLGSPMSQQDLH